jgi:outer membrane protein OmpA-like peptidoglycan-associated protein
MKRFRYLFVLLMIVLLFVHEDSKSQEFMPFAQSNYAGVSGVVLQPASIVDSRYSFDMVFWGGDFRISNNYLSMKREAFFNPSIWNDALWNDDFRKDNFVENLDGKDKSGIVNFSLMLPSFMVNLSDKSAFAFSTRIRGMSNVDNITEDLAKFAFEGFNYEPLLYKNLTNANFSVQGNVWAEFAATYAHVIMNSEKHFLKGGITLKYLKGVASAYTFVRELNYRFDGSDTLSLFQSKVNYGITSNFDEGGIDFMNKVSDPGVGMDLGFVYEYRPDIKKFAYSMDGRDNLLRPDMNKYLFRIGVSLLDFGKINFLKGKYSQDFMADIRDWDISDLSINSVSDLNEILREEFDFDENVKQNFLMNLPAAISIQMDYNLGNNFYLNFSPFFALKQGTNLTTKTHHFTTYNLTPSYDRKWFGVALPMQADEYGRFRAGISLRLGAVWVGSNSIFTNAFSESINASDVYFMFKIPIFRNIEKDSDRDGVSDKFDQCPETSGLWLMHGCPDTDGDGIADQKDECPNDPGPEALNGCPDRDGDGIADKYDRCPDHAGLPGLNGCPDSDGDGIVDFEDECPDQPGKDELRGCPDRDNDGIPDKDDKCPDVPGKPEFQGCPFNDIDGDGIADEIDECPTIPGPAEFNGCPDSDGDGISDKYDLCPNIPGVPENKGCPPIQKEETEIIKRAFSALEFESGKSIIKAVSYPSLNELAELMKTRKMWKVQLSGHTDNTGNPEKNMELSKNRTQAVKDYLIKQGVEEFRIRTEWFGQEMPVADNKTPAGRQKNRRVEMKIVFE